MKTVKKPKANVLGENGNVFNLTAICCRALKRAGLEEKAKELRTRVFAAQSYDESLRIMADYCDLQ